MPIQKRTSAEVDELRAKAREIIAKGSSVKDALAQVGLTTGSFYSKAAKAKREQRQTPIVTKPKLNYCPSCGCNLRAIEVALSL